MARRSTETHQRRALFEALVRDNAQALHVYLRARARDSALADDLFQETLIAAWQDLDRFDHARSFGRWLRGIARNLVRSRERAEARAPRFAHGEVEELLEQHCAALQRLRNDTLDERLERLRACIDGLPSPYREAIDLRYAREVKGRELARKLERGVEATMKLLQRGRRLVYQCMQRRLGPFAEAEP